MEPVSLKTAITIEAAIERVYAFWLGLENFPSFIPALASVEVLDTVNSRWVIRAPLDYEICFDSTIVERSQPDRLVWITRHSAGDARGELSFTGTGSHTRVVLDFRYSLHSPWTQQVARLMNRLGFPSRAIESGLAQIKQQIECRPDVHNRTKPIAK